LQKAFGSPCDILNSDIQLGRHWITTKQSGVKINAVEHYTPLRFLFPGTHLQCDSTEIPHVSSTSELICAIDNKKEEVDVDVPWFTVRGACGWQYPEARNGVESFTMIEPNRDYQLSIVVTISYQGFGELPGLFVFPDFDLLTKVLKVPSPGIPTWLKYPAYWLWPRHYSKVFWPDRRKPEESLRMIILHRVHDILGAIALMRSPIKGAFPSLSVYSQCSGHLADMKVLHMIETVML
jgi:hypothetical protein